MNKDRLEKLLNYHEKDTNDSFVIYAIANEYLGFDDEKAIYYFEILLRDHAEYLPTYYMAAQLYHTLGDTDAALKTYQKGITLSTLKKDFKTLAELKNAYQNLLIDS